jgi:Fuc2NAc and GlcNAc transferase
VTATVMWLGVLAGIVAGLLTGLIRKRALRRGVLDLPNERSSHSTATPRGGGAAIVLVVSAAALVLQWLGALPRGLSAVLLGGGLAVALVGFLDDRRTLPPGVRFAVHLAAAAWALWCLGGLPPLRLGAQVVNLGWPGQALALAAIVWVLNLFNFMDGIDGIAAAEAMFVAFAGTVLGLLVGTAQGVPAMAWIFACACAGFSFWNWPPARIFMGDVGSGYLGYVIAVFALAASHADPAAVWIWLILGGVFFADATLTLVRRGARGERVHEAHRTHAYQRFARRWHSHRRVTLAVSAVNLLWLLPCAALAARRPEYAAWMVLIALVPLAGLAFAAGAGARDEA